MGKREAFSVLFATWPRHDSEPKMDSLVKAFETSCLYSEPWAVEKAIKRFITGNVDGHNMSFRPTPPQVAQLAKTIEAEQGRINEMTDRVRSQQNRIEYKRAPKQQRDAQVNVWNRIKAELSKPDISELAQEYFRRGWSVPGCLFDINGVSFPDGTFQTIEEMRHRINEPTPRTEEHLKWQEEMDAKGAK